VLSRAVARAGLVSKWGWRRRCGDPSSGEGGRDTRPPHRHGHSACYDRSRVMAGIRYRLISSGGLVCSAAERQAHPVNRADIALVAAN
jgi:hypothetical protein